MSFMSAIESGKVEEVIEYLNKNKDLCSVQDPKTGETPLMAAVKRGHVDVVKALIEAGADVNATRRNGYTALHHACDSLGCGQDVSMVRLLCEAGARLDAIDQYGETPLHKACNNIGTDTPELVEVLINAGADPNATDFKGETPLHEAVKHDRADLVDTLMTQWADPYIQENLAQATPLHYAVSFNKRDVLEVLLKHEIDLNVTDHHNCTPLHYAVLRNRPEMAQMLVNAGCDVDRAAVDGRTSLDMAYEKPNREEIISILRPASRRVRAAENTALEEEVRHPAEKSLLPRLKNATVGDKSETKMPVLKAMQLKKSSER